MSKNEPKPTLIHLVDDDRLTLATLGGALARTGYKVERIETLNAARAELKAARPDLLILDIKLPDGLGTELAREVRDSSGVPILFLTAYADQSFLDEAVELGAVGYLVKPITADQLLPMVVAGLAAAKRDTALRESHSGLKGAFEQDRMISLAVGVLMERLGLSHDVAFERLRRAARTRRERIETLACAIVAHVDAANSLIQSLPPD